ncbi:MAG: hypothetical protein ACRDNZ_03445 [Streptosporangiaceae bacterium]
MGAPAWPARRWLGGALGQFPGWPAVLSSWVIATLTQTRKAEAAAFAQRDLPGADGVCARAGNDMNVRFMLKQRQ